MAGDGKGAPGKDLCAPAAGMRLRAPERACYRSNHVEIGLSGVRVTPEPRPLPLSARPFSMVFVLARCCRLKSPRVARIIVRYTMINNARENCLQ